MNKHQKTIALIEAEIVYHTSKVDYYSNLLPKWPHLTYDMEKSEQAISQLQHTRQVLLLIGNK